ncbi:MAG: MBL fold metallo-hydrolase [Alphaproteobacteria bacterium]
MAAPDHHGDLPFTVRFWGVRGSIACPGPETLRYGGNTSCLEVRCGERLLIFDAGTGIRRLGQALDRQAAADGAPLDADIYFSHSHFDHVCGLPFFSSIYNPANTFRLWGGHLGPDMTLREVLCELMMAPLFPIPVEAMASRVVFHDFTCGETLDAGDGIRLVTAPLNHPNGAVGYRIEFGGRAICYVTDTEHPAAGRDENILKLIEGADYFIYDSTYTDEEYPAHKGWGHSTWQEAVRLATAAGVRTCVIFHHDPGHDDAMMDRIAAAAETMRPGTIVAREGMILSA